MKIPLVAAVLFITAGTPFAQKIKDYMEVRDQLRPPLCGIRDSVSSAEVYADLLKFDIQGVRRNISQYYLDLSEMEYLLYMYSSDTTMLRKSADNSALAVAHDPNTPAGLWGAAFGYGHVGDCERMNTFLMAYIARVPLRYRTSDYQINTLIEHCATFGQKQ